MTRLAALLLLSASLGAQAPSTDAARYARVEEAFRKHDANGDGVIARDELKSDDLFKRYDADRDGKITAQEVHLREGLRFDARARARLLGDAPVFDGFGATPRFDFDRDGALDVEELRVLVFAVCAFGGDDRRVSPAEARRAPVPMSGELKSGWLARAFRDLDADGDGQLLVREIRLPPAFLAALDADRDGKASFEELASDQIARLGGYLPKFGATSAAFAGKDALRAAEWPGDAELFRRLDRDDDGRVGAAEFDRYVRELREAAALSGDFLVRYDLDGDRKVSRAEFPGADGVFARLDLDRDGEITAKDRAPKRP
ncbi:MAG TPA: EF-hand domain-containing protein [Planctomycetota bacterium]|nr:EF-hand domain-containing protein [Planctomycetota bacterium]